MCIYIYIHIYHHFEWFNPDSISFLLIQSPRWSAKNPTCFPGELDILLLGAGFRALPCCTPRQHLPWPAGALQG